MLKPVLLSICLAAAPVAVAHSAPADVSAAIAMPGRPAPMVALDASRKPAEVLGWLGLERGDQVLDFFTGFGYHAEIMARAVGPEGRVTAWNTPILRQNPRFRTAVDGVAQRNPNVTLIASPPTALDLPEKAFDFVLVSIVWHDFYWESEDFGLPRLEPSTVADALFRATRPGGIVGVIDHMAAPGRETRAEVDANHRILPDTVRNDFERAGFEFVGSSDLLRNPEDDHKRNVFDPTIRNRTDRFIFKFRRPMSS